MRAPACLSFSALLGCVVLTGCSGFPVTRVDIQAYEALAPKASTQKVFNDVNQVLVERGFDIKVSNRDAGLVTTEYKKFASEGKSPPFDYYLQIKTTVQPLADGRVSIRMSPMVKEQNRLNAAAYTEYELSYFTGEPKHVRLIGSMKAEGWRSRGQTLFMNVVSDVSTRSGIPVDEIKKHITETPENAMRVNE